MFVCTGVSVHRGHAPHLAAGPRHQDVSSGEGRACASGQYKYKNATKLLARKIKIASSVQLKMDRLADKVLAFSEQTEPKVRE